MRWTRFKYFSSSETRRSICAFVIIVLIGKLSSWRVSFERFCRCLTYSARGSIANLDIKTPDRTTKQSKTTARI